MEIIDERQPIRNFYIEDLKQGDTFEFFEVDSYISKTEIFMMTNVDRFVSLGTGHTYNTRDFKESVITKVSTTLIVND